MNKQEFVNGLRRNLSGLDDYEYINDTVNYYENYIESEVRKGETEEAVLRMLGDPGLIAKSIKASKADIIAKPDNEAEEYKQNTSYKGTKGMEMLQKLLALPGWMLKAIAGVVIIVLIVVVVALLNWLLPVIVVGAVAYIFYKFIKDNFLN